MLELHDLIPYLFSISIICTFAYAAYFTSQSIESGAGRQLDRVVCEPLISVTEYQCDREQIHHWLARKTKRKEAPDGDSADCHSLFVDINTPDKRGGFSWDKTMHSLL